MSSTLLLVEMFQKLSRIYHILSDPAAKVLYNTKSLSFQEAYNFE